MTVKELIEALRKLKAPQAEVMVEGCDCVGVAGDVHHPRPDTPVFITRESSTLVEFP